MTDLAEDSAILRAAFPVIEGVARCAFCGAERKRDHALCQSCWFGLPASTRRRYMSLGIFARARMLVAILDGNEAAY